MFYLTAHMFLSARGAEWPAGLPPVDGGKAPGRGSFRFHPAFTWGLALAVGIAAMMVRLRWPS